MAQRRIDRRRRPEETPVTSHLWALEAGSLQERHSLSNLGGVLIERAMLFTLSPTMNWVGPPADLQNSCD
jgi:hypothetical protein